MVKFCEVVSWNKATTPATPDSIGLPSPLCFLGLLRRFEVNHMKIRTCSKHENLLEFASYTIRIGNCVEDSGAVRHMKCRVVCKKRGTRRTGLRSCRKYECKLHK
jgi:hypothetical protein